MKKRRAEIHLGDLARALKRLQWQDEAQAAAIAAHLGFGLSPGRHPAEQSRPPREIYDRQLYRSPIPTSTTQRPPPVHTPPAPRPQPELPRNILPGDLTTLAQAAPAAPDGPDWLEQPDDHFAQPKQPALARLPLFPDAASRAILSAALATGRPGAEVDIAALVKAICRREAVGALPRLAEATLERGCQLLLDYSASMVPWWEDLTSLKHQVLQVVGEELTEVYSFDRDPTAAARWTHERKREPWRPDGRPVLVATDFAIQGREGRAMPSVAWQAAIRRCAREGSPLLVLIPWPETRWPRDFGIAATPPTLVHWSPHTSAAMIGHRLSTRS